MRISDWSSDVCSSDLETHPRTPGLLRETHPGTPRPLREPHPRPPRPLRETHPRTARPLGETHPRTPLPLDRKIADMDKSVSVRLILVGSRSIKNKTQSIKDSAYKMKTI